MKIKPQRRRCHSDSDIISTTSSRLGSSGVRSWSSRRRSSFNSITRTMEKNLDSMSESLDQDNNDSLLSIDTSDSLLMIRPIRECFVGSERNAPDTSPKIFASDPFEKSECSRVLTSAVDSRNSSFETSKSSTLFSELDATENDTASLAALDDGKISTDISSKAEAILLQTTEESEVSNNGDLEMRDSRSVSNVVMDNHQVLGNSTILESSSNSHVELVSSMDQSDDELSADISPTTEAKLLRTTEKSEVSDNSNSDLEMCDSRLFSNLALEVNNNNGPLANSTFVMTNSNSNVEFDSHINQVGGELSADITPITEAKLLQTTEESQLSNNGDLEIRNSRSVSNVMMDNHQVLGNSIILVSSSNSHVELFSSMDRSNNNLVDVSAVNDEKDVAPKIQEKRLSILDKEETEKEKQADDDANDDREEAGRMVSAVADETSIVEVKVMKKVPPRRSSMFTRSMGFVHEDPDYIPPLQLGFGRYSMRPLNTEQGRRNQKGRVVKPYLKCGVCGKVCKERRLLQTHMARHLGEMCQVVEEKTGKKSFICLYRAISSSCCCGKACKNKGGLASHLQVHCSTAEPSASPNCSC